jgi:hypothetical protein
MSIYTAADISDYKNFAGVTGTTADDLIARMLDVAWTTAEQWTGLTLNRQLGVTGTGVLEHWIGEGGSVYWPKNTPLISVVSLTIQSDVIAASPIVSWSTNGYYIDEDYAIRLRGYEFAEGADCYLYSCYGLTPVSEDLRQAVFELTAVKMRLNDHMGKKSTTGASRETVTWFDSDITPSVAAVFDRYKLVRV